VKYNAGGSNNNKIFCIRFANILLLVPIPFFGHLVALTAGNLTKKTKIDRPDFKTFFFNEKS
jgi:hypothetical protein